MTKSNKIVTDFAHYIRVSKEDQTRYYPEVSWAELRKDFPNVDSTRMGGFAVYDTRISTSYAIELFPTKEQAEDFSFKPGELKTLQEAEDIAEVDSVDSSNLAGRTGETTNVPGVSEEDNKSAGKRSKRYK